MKHNWEYKKLGEVCEVLYGYPFDSSYFNIDGRGMPLIRIRDVKSGKTSTFYSDSNYSKEYIIKKGDFLIGMDGEFNISPWKSDEALLNQRVCKISSKHDSLFTHYLFYFLILELKKIEDKTPFVTVKHLSDKVLKSVKVPIPTVEIQKNIIKELDEINSMIEGRKEQIKLLDQLAQSIFYEMFGDPNVKLPFDYKKIEDVTINLDSKRIPITQKNREFGIYPYYGASGIVDYVSDFIFDGTFLLVSEDGANLLVRSHPIAFIAKGKIWVNNHAHILDCDNYSSKIFISFYLNLLDFHEKITGMAQPKFTQQALNQTKIAWPPISLQEEFAARIELIEEQKKDIENSIKELETLLASRMDYWFN